MLANKIEKYREKKRGDFKCPDCECWFRNVDLCNRHYNYMHRQPQPALEEERRMKNTKVGPHKPSLITKQNTQITI